MSNLASMYSADSPQKAGRQEKMDDSWVSSLTSSVQQSSQWSQAMTVARGRLFELISQRQAMLFSDLSGEERAALIDELEVDMWNSEDYSAFAEHAASQVAVPSRRPPSFGVSPSS